MMELAEIKVSSSFPFDLRRTIRVFNGQADLQQALRSLSHPNIVGCKELLLDRKGHAHMVFELIPGGNLESLTRKREKRFTERQVRSVFFQLLRATSYMHAQRYLHRDIKPENILVQHFGSNGTIRIKLADLGLSKKLSPKNSRPHTTYVATRWYRSPEILLHMSNYGYPSDMWAIGTVMAEMIRLGDPLFPGSNEDEQLARIIALRGHPSMVNWRAGEDVMKKRRIRLPKVTTSSLKTVIRDASLPTLQLISDLLELDPNKRPTAAEALSYPLFVMDSHDEEDVFRSRKRRKVISEDLDTARSREYPATAFTYRSEENPGVEEIDLLRALSCDEHHTLTPPENAVRPRQFYPSVSEPRVFHLSPLRRDHDDSEERFSGQRKPAGLFSFHVVR
eukprot:gb/GEZJ01000783.1/.p1 GENE.gb/GEZJ01000783.1/~~gb/GEZJ01000783.1/.p1  ORF type:complete len:393 (+),score=46.78 gb/GEZJ01000783.1/:137-1315(+)